MVANLPRMESSGAQTIELRIARSGDWIIGIADRQIWLLTPGDKALGYVVVEEIIAASLRDKWLLPFQKGADPIETLIEIVQATSLRAEVVRVGCPLNNLAQEMSHRDERFRKRLAKVFHDWREGTAAVLRRGQSEGIVRRDRDARETASFLIAMYEGYVMLAKNAQDVNGMESRHQEYRRVAGLTSCAR